MRKYKLMFLMFLCLVVIGCGKTNKINTITFRNGNETYQVEVKNGKITDKISTPTKDGYKFVGWYVDDKLYNFNDEITQDIVLTAKWEKIEDTTNKTADEDNNKKKKETNSSNDEKKQSNENNNQSNNRNTNNNQQSNNQVNSQNTVKTIEENESILFSISTQDEVNMLRGTTQITQNGENGIKTITYKVTYDSTGKEISKEKITEKVTKQPINQITKVGISDYNLNSDTYSYSLNGVYCSDEQLIDLGDGIPLCIGDFEGYFNVINLKGISYIYNYSVGQTSKENAIFINIRPLVKLSGNRPNFRGSLNGRSYNFQFLAGGVLQNEIITQEVCDTYNLACGRW